MGRGLLLRLLLLLVLLLVVPGSCLWGSCRRDAWSAGLCMIVLRCARRLHICSPAELQRGRVACMRLADRAGQRVSVLECASCMAADLLCSSCNSMLLIGHNRDLKKVMPARHVRRAGGTRPACAYPEAGRGAGACWARQAPRTSACPAAPGGYVGPVGGSSSLHSPVLDCSEDTQLGPAGSGRANPLDTCARLEGRVLSSFVVVGSRLGPVLATFGVLRCSSLTRYCARHGLAQAAVHLAATQALFCQH